MLSPLTDLYTVTQIILYSLLLHEMTSTYHYCTLFSATSSPIPLRELFGSYPLFSLSSPPPPPPVAVLSAPKPLQQNLCPSPPLTPNVFFLYTKPSPSLTENHKTKMSLCDKQQRNGNTVLLMHFAERSPAANFSNCTQWFQSDIFL